MSPIKVGIVGLSSTGWASTALVPSLLRPSVASSYTITTLSTTSPASASASAQKYSEIVGHPIKPYHGDTSQIANDANVDLVVVAVKAPAHKAALLPAIEAGKDVFVEWPAGVGLKEASEIADAAKRKGVRTIVGLQGRQSPAVKKVKEIIKSGKIGKVLSSSVIALAPRELGYWGPEVKENNAYSVDPTNGATVLSLAVGQQLDLVTYLLGPHVSVSATTAQHYPTVTMLDANGTPTERTLVATAPDQVAFTGLFKSGAISSVIWRGGLPSTQGRKQFLWEIDGEEGSIRLEDTEQEMGSAFISVITPKVFLNGEEVAVDDDEGDGKAVDSTTTGWLGDNLARAWKEFAKGEKGEYATVEDAVKNHQLLDAISRSAKEGRVIQLE